MDMVGMIFHQTTGSGLESEYTPQTQLTTISNLDMMLKVSIKIIFTKGNYQYFQHFITRTDLRA
ncbi:hypothetical protein Hanom_Chr17g01563981 [Helianthus anomalus]